MRETFKNKSGGDKLSAGFVNKLAKTARRAAAAVASSYGYGREGASMSHTPWQQIIVKITGTPDEDGLQSAVRMYFDEDGGGWLVDGDANPIDVDPSPFDLAVQVGDVVAGWWHEQRGAFLPITTKPPTPTTTSPPPDPPPEVVTPCGCTCVNGVTLPGSPIVCCRGPLIFKYDGWPGLLFELKWKGGDQWATDPFVGPECNLGNNTQGENLYRWLMEASAVFGEAELRLEIVTNNGCPAVCIIYRSLKKFICRCSNEFYLYDWKNIERDKIPCGDVCVHPVGESSQTPSMSQSCIMLASRPLDVPGAFSLDVTGFDGFQRIYVGGGAVGSIYAKYFLASSAGSGGADININKTYTCSLGNAYYSGTYTPSNQGGCFPSVPLNVCTIYGGQFSGFPFPQPPYDVGYESFSTWNAQVRVRVFASMLIYLIRIEEFTPGNVGLMLLARVQMPGVTPALIFNGPGDLYATFKSEVFQLDSDEATQSDVDALFDQQFTLTFCNLSDGVNNDLDPAAYPDITISDVIYARSLSSAVLADAQPTDSGACDSNCTPDQAAIGEDDDSDPGGCCIDGKFFRELTQTECNEANGTWYDDVTAGADACEGLNACCDPDGPCFMATEDQCLNLGGLPQGNGTSCGGSHPCVGDTSSQSASSVSASSVSASSVSASSVSASSASSVSASSQPLIFGACCCDELFCCYGDAGVEGDCVPNGPGLPDPLCTNATFHPGQSCLDACLGAGSC
jgi:hypothetical protein